LSWSEFAGAGGGGQMAEVIVPRACVGMIIGKGGENIKRLAMETGARIQFKQDGRQHLFYLRFCGHF
jgi:far upstream element-binding protein